jgi:hypothetical protein
MNIAIFVSFCSLTVVQNSFKMFNYFYFLETILLKASQICYAVLCVFSYMAVGKE